MNNRSGRQWTVVATLLVLSACSPNERVETATVLSHNNCKGAATGLREVTLAEVARIRGSELLANTVAPNISSAAAENPAVPSDMPRFVAISRGPQPSRGFELHLADQANVISPTQLQVPVYWTAPDPTKSHPLVTTHPCLVVSLPRGPWEKVDAIDQHGKSLGELVLLP